MKKKLIQFFRVAAMATLALGWQSTLAAPIQLNMSELLPDNNFMVQNVKRFASAIAKETNGEVVIKVFPAGMLGFRGHEQMRAVRNGQVAMADIVASQQIAEEPLFGIEGIPF